MASGDKAFRRYLYDFGRKVANPVDQGDGAVPLKIGDIVLFENIISAKEEEYALRFMSGPDWEESKCNVKKQEFGPTIDFTARKVDCRSNTGLPRYSRCLLKHLQNLSSLEFVPDRQRLLELCASHDTPKFSWVTTAFHDHHWLFTDVTVLICLQSDIVVCLDSEAEGSTIVRVELPMQARSAVVLSGDVTHRQINVDAARCLTRCLLLTYNSVKLDPSGVSPEDLQCIKYFRDKYVGLPTHEFANKYAGYVYAKPADTLPLMVQSFSQHHLPIDVLKSIMEKTYKDMTADSIEIIDGIVDINMLIQLAHGKVWGKLTVCSSYINQCTLDAGLKLQSWLFTQEGVRVPEVIKPVYFWSEEESRSTSVTNSDYSIAIARNRDHLMWLMQYMEEVRLCDQEHIDIAACLRKVGYTISEFHKTTAKYPMVDIDGAKHFPHFLSSSSYQNDVEVLMKKVFVAAPNHDRQKLLICCLHRLQRCFKANDKILAPTGIIHTYFHPKSLLGLATEPGPFTIVHFAYIRYGFLITDLILTLMRFYVYFRIHAGNMTPSYTKSLEYLLEGYGREFDREEKPLVCSFMLGLCAVYLLETCEELAAVTSEQESTAKDAVEVELRKSAEIGFNLLEELCRSRDNMD